MSGISSDLAHAATGDRRLATAENAACMAVERLLRAIETLGDGFVLFDQDDRLVHCNRRYREIFPKSAAAMVPGARFEDILRHGLAHGQYAVDAGEQETWLAARLAARRAPHSSIEFELGDGRWVQAIEHATPDGGRSGLRIDITERKRQEAAALATQRQLEATLRAIPDLLFEVDGEGRFVACHVTDPCRLLVPPAALIGRTIAETLPADAAAICRAALAEALATGSSTGRQYRLDGFAGGEWFELSVARKEHDGAGGEATHPPHCIVLVRDITERKKLAESLAAERDFLEQIMATSLSAIVVIDAAGRIVFRNKAAERVLSIDALTERCFDDPALRVTTLDGSPYPEDQLPWMTVLRTAAPVFDVRLAIELDDGRRRLLSVNATPLGAGLLGAGPLGAGPLAVGPLAVGPLTVGPLTVGPLTVGPLAVGDAASRRVVCSVTDITDQIEAEAALRRERTLLRGLFELCPLGIALTDLETGRFIDVNDAVLEQLGYARDELLELSHFDITPEAHHRRDRQNREIFARAGRHSPHEKENIRKDGSRFPVLLRSAVVTDGAGRKLVWSIVEDITQRKADEAQILRQAYYDALTGLPNRLLFQERLTAALERARRGRHIGAVAMLDLDHFKTVNDGWGHKAGDEVLIEAARRLAACTRATDTVARFGGDEFLLLLDDIHSAEAALAIAEKVQRALARPFDVEGSRIELGVSIGFALFPADSHDLDELLRFADRAMYEAKHAGCDLARLHAGTCRGRPQDGREGRDPGSRPLK